MVIFALNSLRTLQMPTVSFLNKTYTHRRKHRGDAGDASPEKSQCGGRQCYSSPQILTWKTAKFSPKIHQNPFFSEPRWGSLQRSPRPSSWLGGGSLPPSQEPPPRSQPFGLRASALRASLRPSHFLDRGYAYEFMTSENEKKTSEQRNNGSVVV